MQRALAVWRWRPNLSSSYIVHHSLTLKMGKGGNASSVCDGESKTRSSAPSLLLPGLHHPPPLLEKMPPSLSSFFVFIHLFRLLHLSPDPQRLCLKFLPSYSPLISWFYSQIYSPTFPLLLNHFPNFLFFFPFFSHIAPLASLFSPLKATFLSLITPLILV